MIQFVIIIRYSFFPLKPTANSHVETIISFSKWIKSYANAFFSLHISCLVKLISSTVDLLDVKVNWFIEMLVLSIITPHNYSHKISQNESFTYPSIIRTTLHNDFWCLFMFMASIISLSSRRCISRRINKMQIFWT